MIEIKVIGNTPLETLSAITAWGMLCMTNKDVREAADQILAAKQHKNETVSFLPSGHGTADSQAFGNLNPAPVVPAPMPNAPAAAPVPNVPPVPVSPDPVTVHVPVPAATRAVPAPVPITPAVSIAPTAPAPSLTLEQVGKAGADLVAGNPAKMTELLGLLGQFGVQAVTELKPEQVGPFATALRGLGGKI